MGPAEYMIKECHINKKLRSPECVRELSYLKSLRVSGNISNEGKGRTPDSL